MFAALIGHPYAGPHCCNTSGIASPLLFTLSSINRYRLSDARLTAQGESDRNSIPDICHLLTSKGPVSAGCAEQLHVPPEASLCSAISRRNHFAKALYWLSIMNKCF